MFTSPAPISSLFVKSAAKTLPVSTINKTPLKQNLLSGVNDWQLMVDFEHSKLVFPPEVYSTDLRPDILIWSQNSRMILLIELIVPAEENILLAQIWKTARHEQLAFLAKLINS